MGKGHSENLLSLASELEEKARIYFLYYHFSTAESLYSRALEIRQKCQGLSHPNVAAVSYELAQTLCEQSRYAEARSLFLRAIAIWKAGVADEQKKLALQSEIIEELERLAFPATKYSTNAKNTQLAS